VKQGTSNVMCRLIQQSASACMTDYPRKGHVQGHMTVTMMLIIIQFVMYLIEH